MHRSLLTLSLLALFRSVALTAQDTGSVIEAASKAMGPALESIQYSGAGSVYMLGQAVRPDAPWPQFRLVKYVSSVDYSAPAMREELVRSEIGGAARGGGAGGFDPATGQGGMRPILGEVTQARLATPRTYTGLVEIWMTPHGFLRGASLNHATVRAAAGGKTTVSFTAMDKYTVTGTFNREHLLERVETLVDNPVLGDMPVEVTYAEYKDFAGVTFPTRIVRREGGHPVLDVTITEVRANGASGLVPGGAAAPVAPRPVAVETAKIGDGLWDIAAGGLHSMLVEFSDHLLVVEASGNDARSDALIAEVKRLVPAKPIRYLVNTHAHFDHSGGVRRFAAEGATILTHEINKPYFDRVFRNPHRLDPDSLARSGRTAVIEGVGSKRVVTDGARTVELHHIRGNFHNDGLLMVFLPKEKLLLQADAFHPRPGAPPYRVPPQFTVNLVENVQRLKLDVARVFHIHGGIDLMAVVAKAAVPLAP